MSPLFIFDLPSRQLRNKAIRASWMPNSPPKWALDERFGPTMRLWPMMPIAYPPSSTSPRAAAQADNRVDFRPGVTS